MYIRILQALICLLLFFPFHLFPTPLTKPVVSDLNSWIKENAKNGNIPGLSLGIIREGKISYINNFGISNDYGKLIDTETQYYIGSITKALTAVSILQLSETGRIDLDAPLGNYLTSAPDPDVSQISVKKFLSQSGGLRARDGLLFRKKLLGKSFSSWNIYSRLKAYPHLADRFEYSNINFNLMGLLIEEVSGIEYKTFIQRKIISPLGLKKTVDNPEKAVNLTHGYQLWFQHPVYIKEAPVYENYFPAMGYISTMEDLLKFSDFLIRPIEYSDKKILSESYVRKLFQPVVSASFSDLHGKYALGWHTGEIEGKKVYLIQGGTGGSLCYIYLVPEDQTGIVLLTNMNSTFQCQHTKSIVPGIITLLSGKKPVPVKPKNTYMKLCLVLTCFILFNAVFVVINIFSSRINRTCLLTLHYLLDIFLLVLMYLILPRFWNMTLSAMNLAKPDLLFMMHITSFFFAGALCINTIITRKRSQAAYSVPRQTFL